MLLKTYLEQEYQQLKTELMVCVSGGLFLALYQDKQTPNYTISRLQNELPKQFNLELYLNKDKTNFPVFFRYLFEDINKEPTVYHVLGIDSLADNDLEEFLKNLQYNRDNFKALPYSLVFWVKADLVKTIFHHAPDFYHWLFGNYDFSNTTQQPEFIGFCVQAQEQLNQQEKLLKDSICTYLKKLIWQYDNWQDVKKEEFLNEVMSRADLNRYYVNLNCTDQNGKVRLLENLLDEFLHNPQHSFLALLGDFGTGKSSFSLHYFIQQARLYIQDSSQRIPIFISLKDYPKQFQLSEFLEKEFCQRFNLTFQAKAFQDLALRGRFMFFFDGFDEMVSMVSEEETIENFKTITHLSFENLQFLTQNNNYNYNKLFLTCRSHYFLTNAQEKNILRADKTILYRNYTKKTQYQISRINIKEFEQKQIEQYIRINTDTETQALEFINIIKNTYNLKELSTRPLMLDMIFKTLPLLKDRTEINVADLYHTYTDQWIGREDWRSCLSPEGKRKIMWDLSVKMYEKGGDFSLNYSELDKPDKKYFKINKYNYTNDYFIYEATTCSFLNRDLSGKYKFIHKSFMEYFLAEYIFYKELRENKKRLFRLLKIKEICFFFKYILILNKKKLNGLNFDFLDFYGINLQGANLQGANFKNADLAKVNFQGANLQGANLQRANLEKGNFGNANFHKGNLQGANLQWAFIQEANFDDANLQGANLEHACLVKASLKNANFQNANLKYASLKGANLENANFHKANLKWALLLNAHINEDTIFTEADTTNCRYNDNKVKAKNTPLTYDPDFYK